MMRHEPLGHVSLGVDGSQYRFRFFDSRSFVEVLVLRWTAILFDLPSHCLIIPLGPDNDD